MSKPVVDMSDPQKRAKWLTTADDVELSLCVSCQHKWKGGANCDAYPKGIPMKILTNEVDHRKPYFGDNGIQYEKRR